MKRKNLILIVLYGLLAAACTKAVIDEEDTEPVTPPTLPTSAVYNDDVKNIMNNYCVTCHGGSAPSAGLNLTNYSGVKAAAQSGALQNRMNSTTSPMPASGMLPQDVRSVIDKWVMDGYPEN